MWLIFSLHHIKCWQWWNYHIQCLVRVFKIYLYKRQTKKRNSFICFLLLRLLEAFVLVLLRAFFFREVVRDRRRVIDVIFHENLCIRILHVDDFEHHRIKILFLFRKFFLHNFLHFHVHRRLLADIYHFFILFFFLFFIYLLQRRCIEQLNYFNNSFFRLRQTLSKTSIFSKKLFH